MCIRDRDINDIPGTLPAGRTKPWGTGQAVLVAKKVIKTPFIVINACLLYTSIISHTFLFCFVSGFVTSLIIGIASWIFNYSLGSVSYTHLVFFGNDQPEWVAFCIGEGNYFRGCLFFN